MLTRNDVSVIWDFFYGSNIQDVTIDCIAGFDEISISYYHSNKVIVITADDFMGVITSLPSNTNDIEFLREFGVCDYDERFSELAYIINNSATNGHECLFSEVSDFLLSFNITYVQTPVDCWMCFKDGNVVQFENDEFLFFLINHIFEWIECDTRINKYDDIHAKWLRGEIKITSLVRRLYDGISI
jgi:hypothetical protein